MMITLIDGAMISCIGNAMMITLIDGAIIL